MRRINQAIACPHLCHCFFGKTISLSQEKNENEENINLYNRYGEFGMLMSKIGIECFTTVNSNTVNILVKMVNFIDRPPSRVVWTQL